MEYPIRIAGLERKLPLCPVNENLYIAAFVMFGDVELTVACAKALLERAPQYDVMITAESKGIPLVYEMARQRGGERYLLARKAPKLYMRDVLKCEVRSITTAADQVLYLDGRDVDYMRGRRVLIVDDVVSTGESLRALETLVAQSGGITVGKMTVLAEGDAAARDDIVYLEKIPLFDRSGNAL